jgi:hypothetical protein
MGFDGVSAAAQFGSAARRPTLDCSPGVLRRSGNYGHNRRHGEPCLIKPTHGPGHPLCRWKPYISSRHRVRQSQRWKRQSSPSVWARRPVGTNRPLMGLLGCPTRGRLLRAAAATADQVGPSDNPLAVPAAWILMAKKRDTTLGCLPVNGGQARRAARRHDPG